MSEAFERAVTALNQCYEMSPIGISATSEQLVRAVLEAIREPTEDMLIACHKAVVFEQDTPEYVGWQAMIDELLREG